MYSIFKVYDKVVLFFSDYINIFADCATEVSHYWQNTISKHEEQVNIQDDLTRMVIRISAIICGQGSYFFINQVNQLFLLIIYFIKKFVICIYVYILTNIKHILMCKLMCLKWHHIPTDFFFL